MSFRPSFQFYPADWRANAKLGRCSEAARGAWIDLLCIFHEADEYGLVRWPLVELARAAKVRLSLVQELVSKEVLKGSDGGAHRFVFRPFHAGKHGVEVVLAEACNDGPVWYSSRMLTDEWRRKQRGSGTRFSITNQPPSRSPTRRVGDAMGDGPTSASVSVEEEEQQEPVVVPPAKKRAASPGTRWPADAVISEEWIDAADVARMRHHMPPTDLRLEAERFVNFWASKTGKDATKVDWRRTWINWVLSSKGNGNGHAQKRTAHDKFLAAGLSLIEDFGRALPSPESPDDDGGLDPAGRPLLPP